METAKYANQDSYVDQETGVLKNKKNICCPTELANYEMEYSAARSLQLSQQPVQGQFDLDHLCAIHRHLFGDVYIWAGEIRDVDIAKGDSLFAHHAYIRSAAKQVFKQLAAEHYLLDLPEPVFCDRAAYYMSEINALHPFREGNGRAQREFISQLAKQNGYFIDWSGMRQYEMLDASIISFQTGSTTRLAALISANLQRLETAITLT